MANEITPTTVMLLLWAFEIVPLEGEARPDPANAEFVDAVVAYVHLYVLLTGLTLNCSGPASFRCQFRPRSESIVRLILEATTDG